MNTTRPGNNGQKTLLENSLIVDTLKRWAIRFKDRTPSPAEFAVLCQDYFEDLLAEGFTAAEFIEVEKIVRRRCRFFPTMAEILAAREEYREKRRLERQRVASLQKQLPDLTPEQLNENRRQLRQLITDMGWNE